jgi:hypothetical protein
MRACIFAIALLLVGYQSGVSAASVMTGAHVVPFDIDNNPLGFICPSYVFGTSPPPPLPPACHGTYAIPGSASTLTYDASASADYGTLQVFAQSSISLTAAGSGGPEYIITWGIAEFRDQWTINGGTAGTTGTLELSFDITGSYDSNIDASQGSAIFLQNYTKSMFVDDVLIHDQFPDYTSILSTEFTFGEEFDFMVHLDGSSILLNLSMGGYDGQTSYIDMSAIMSSIVVKDSFGNVIPFSLSTASGAALFDDLAATVPIPAAIWLFGSGLLGLVGVSRRKKTA